MIFIMLKYYRNLNGENYKEVFEMNIFKRITAVMLSTAMLAGTAYAAAVQQDGDISGISAAAANTSSAPKLNKGVISLGNG